MGSGVDAGGLPFVGRGVVRGQDGARGQGRGRGLCVQTHTDWKGACAMQDTDRTREVPGSVENIITELRWCGLDYDEGIA